MQIIPLWGAIGLASVVCGGFMIKYFGGHTEISWSKSMRATYDHQVRCRPLVPCCLAPTLPSPSPLLLARRA